LNSQAELIRIGLDIGSVSAKYIVLLPIHVLNSIPHDEWTFVERIETRADYGLVVSRLQPVLGDPVGVARKILRDLSVHFPDEIGKSLNITGSQAKKIADILQVPYVNEFKAVSRGVAEVTPDARTILEIGGDGSRYLSIRFDAETERVSILDYERNGDCAAGTGSFIDQQAVRLQFGVEEIGPMVAQADTAANIAGRCSVFAKSDMVHAQQRGYDPGAIFKGLCEAVVRNYKGTVLRGKALHPKVVFVGGVAANEGVVQAMHHILGLSEEELVIPPLFTHVSALGCALSGGEENFSFQRIDALRRSDESASRRAASMMLDISRVRYARKGAADSEHMRQTTLRAYLGIDVGSVSTNLVLIDEQGKIIDEIYTRTEGQPIKVVQREFKNWLRKWGGRVQILGVGTTGSGRELIGELVGADAVHDEITAHKTGASFIAETLFNEQVDTIFEIGGQDSKFISVENGIVVDFTMNEVCAAGTGSFLEEQATKMGISIKDDFANLALSSVNPVKMGERCTVFMEKDVTAYLQQGVSKPDIAAGLAFAVVHNYLNRVVRGRKIGNRIYFQGGTAYNKAVAAAFASVLEKTIVVPPHNGVMGAIGAALLAREKMLRFPGKSRFHGFDLSQVDFSIRHIRCKACSNLCDVQQITVNNEKTYWGDKCSERFRKKKKVQRKPVIPDLFEMYFKLLFQDFPSPDGLGIKIGIPRAMYFYDRFPFWRTYFAILGAELVITETTNVELVKKGRELCIAEPCFPIIVAHGHVKDLLDQTVDYIFVPNVINTETEFMQTESWYCPWGQTLPLVIKNTLMDKSLSDRILAPVIRFRDGMKSVQKALLPLAAQLGVSASRSNGAVETAYYVQQQFRSQMKEAGKQSLQILEREKEQALILVGRSYNIFDFGVNLNIPRKLKDDYGMNVIPMDFVPHENIDISDIHENMFWSYGRRILQTARFVHEHRNLHIIYFTNFKCGPDSYIKHFVRNATGAPFLTLQFDGHGNDAGMMTRCEAYLESKGLLEELTTKSKTQICSMKGD